MEIVIVGDGKVGYTLAEQLSQENHNITVIDNDPEALSRVTDFLDVIGVEGNGASYDVQKEAGVAEADLLIAATSSDEVNMICCLIARKLGARHTIARIRNPEYSRQLYILKEELAMSMVINPEHAAAVEISRLISFPSAINTGSFAKGMVDVVELKIDVNNPLDGKSLAQINKENKVNVLICAVERDNKLIIPDGNFVLHVGDHIYICGDNKKIARFIHSSGIASHRIRSVMIIGAGKISYYLSKILVEMGIHVQIIERDPHRCEIISDNFPHVLVIEGDGSEQNLLDAEGIDSVDAFVALTNIDEENLLIAMYAAKKGVPKVITKLNRLNYLDIIKETGIDSVISPKYITAYQIVQYVRAMENAVGSQVKTLYRIAEGQAEIVEFLATNNTLHLGEKLRDIKTRPDVLITAIVRDRQLVIPTGNDHIEENDSVVIITTKKMFNDLNNIFI
ncbi:MAG: Trk system potassium transporter TrkA [Bacillota bacterium]|jgi:trk system potassium uptake protein TrkA